AFANGTFNGNNVTSNIDEETVLAEQNPTLLTVKIASLTTYSFVGQNITYTYTVNNSGNVGILAPINITDNKTGTFTIKNSELAPGQNATGTSNYTITQADLDLGFVTNSAFATGIFGNSAINSTNVTTTITAQQNPALLTVKIASPINYSAVGQNITYTYTVTNSGNVNITGPITIKDNKTGAFQIPVNVLEPGQNATGISNYIITQADIDSGSVTNSAFANGKFNGNNVTSNTDNETVVAEHNPVLLINKTAQPDTYSAVGDIIIYTFNITNIGNTNITGPIRVDDNKTGIVNIEVENLVPGQSVSENTAYKIIQEDLDTGFVTNSAYATGIFGNNSVTSKPDNKTLTAKQAPDLVLDKSASPATYSAVGDIITYTYNVTNVGNVIITGPIRVTDSKLGVISISERNLAPGQNVTGTANYTITQADIESGFIINAAYANGTFNGNSITSNADNEIVTARQNPAFNVNKSASPVTYDSLGQIITYTYNITNSGNVKITGPIKIVDNKTGIINVTEGNLSPGQSILANVTYSITQSDLDLGSVSNLAFATGTFGNNTTISEQDTETINAIQSPTLLINKSGGPDTYSIVGDIITYTYNVTNSGNVNISGPFTIKDNKIGIIQVTDEILVPGQIVTVNSTYSITQQDLNAGSVTNSAYVTAISGNKTITSSPANKTIFAVQDSALSIKKSASSATYSAIGDIITYTYNVTNAGNVIISGPIIITDDKIGTINITEEYLEPGQRVLTNATYMISQADIDSGFVTNSAYATGTFGNNTINSEPDKETVIAVQNLLLLINKSAFPEIYDSVGQIITYTYNVTNIGNVNVKGPINITDNRLGVIPIREENLIPGQSVLVNTTYTITQTDIDSGSITNSAYATGIFRNNTTTSNTDSETVTAVQLPALLIEKSASIGSYSAAGDTITYTYNITNAGNVIISGPITITDDKIGIINVTSENLAPGQSTTKYANYRISQADVDSGSVTNSAYATGILGNNITTSNTDNVTITTSKTPGYIIDKIAIDIAGNGPNANITAAGDEIRYLINVQNTGNLNLTNVSLNDSLTEVSGPIESLNNNKVLEVGENWTYTGNYTVSQEDLNSNGNGTGFIKNDATVNCDQLKPRNDSAFVQINQNPVHIIEKTVIDVAGKGPEGNITAAGDIIRYRINISNTGNVDFTNVTVADSLINLDGPAESLSSDKILQVTENWTYTGNYTVTQEDINSNGNRTGIINNTVTVDCDQAEPSSDNAQVKIENKPGYVIDKIAVDVSGNGQFGNMTKPKDIITYQINVTNTGNVNLTNVTLNDSLITVSGPVESIIQNGILEVGETWTYTGTYTVTVKDIYTNGDGNGFIENTATVDCDQLDPESDSAKVPIQKKPVEDEPACIIDKTVIDVAGKGTSGSVIAAGDIITYEIAVINDGNIDLTNITVSDTIIENLKGPEESINQNGVLEVNEIWTYTGNYTVTQADIDNNGNVNGIGIEFGNGYIENTATVFCDQTEPDSDTEKVPIGNENEEEKPDCTIEKEVLDVAGKGPGAYIEGVGDKIQYQITVKNTGKVDLTNPIVEDTLIDITGPIETSNTDGVLEI
ncbi:MAG: beta strand repeat-containing protein, partial [Methanosarcina sp.]